MPDDVPLEGSEKKVASLAQSEPTDNPLASGLNIAIFVPENIEIKMVDASVLSDYEIWMFISSILASATVGFWVAYTQADEAKSGDSGYVLHFTQVLAGLFITTCVTAFFKRRRLTKKSKSIKLKVTGAQS